MVLRRLVPEGKPALVRGLEIAAGNAAVYGINTGFGKLASIRIDAADVATLLAAGGLGKLFGRVGEGQLARDDLLAQLNGELPPMIDEAPIRCIAKIPMSMPGPIWVDSGAYRVQPPPTPAAPGCSAARRPTPTAA